MAASVVMAYRSDTTTSCRYSLGNGSIILSGYFEPVLTTSASAIGGSELFFSNSAMTFQGLQALLLTSTFSILFRVRPTVSAGSRGLYSLGVQRTNKIAAGITSGHLIGTLYNDQSTVIMNSLTMTGGTPSQFTTTGTHQDIVHVFNLNTLTGAVMTYSNGTITSTLNITALWKTGAATNGKEIPNLNFGTNETWVNYSGGLNEIVIWNKALTSTTINAMPLVSTGGVTSSGALNGGSRTSWVDVAAFDAYKWTSITAAQIKFGATQTQAGLVQTGNYQWVTIPAAQIKSGVSTTQDGATILGTYQWDTLAAANIKFGINHIQDGVTFTGTFLWNTVPASVIKFGTNTIQDSATITGTYLWNTVPAASIKIGVNTIQDSATITGTYDGSDRWSTLTAANVKFGISFTANNVGFTGSYRWDTLPAANIQFGINHIQDGVTFTGTLLSEVWSTLAASQIKFGINQIQNSVTVTGSYLWDTISASNIRSGINHIQDGVTFTGSFSGETWTTITAAQIAVGVNQIQNGVTVTGTLIYPIAVSGTAGTVDIANIKEQIRYVMYANNTATGAPVSDISNGLTKRIQDVFKVHPEKILIGGHQMPALTVYLTSKSIEAKTIAKNQVVAKREANLVFSIVGLVTNQIVPNNYTQDNLDDDIEALMENVELVFRNYGDLGGYTRWSFPNNVTYHSSALDERNQLRVGILDLQCKVFY